MNEFGVSEESLCEPRVKEARIGGHSREGRQGTAHTAFYVTWSLDAMWWECF